MDLEIQTSEPTGLFLLSRNLSKGSEIIDYLVEEEETIFDSNYVRYTLICLYSIVFFFCLFGNLAVILLVTLHWKMRSITKFCLGNLAFADLCVGVFCVYQNLSTFLSDRWLFGGFMCKMYHYINSLSHTASILILVVICVERYLAILHPFRSREWITITRLRVAIIGVWILSALVCSPRLYYINIITYPVKDDSLNGTLRYEATCAPKHSLYSAPFADACYFLILFILPLLVMSVLYTRIGIYVWKGSEITGKQLSLGSVQKSNISSANATTSGSGSIRSNRSPSESCRVHNGPIKIISWCRQAVRYSCSEEADSESHYSNDTIMGGLDISLDFVHQFSVKDKNAPNRKSNVNFKFDQRNGQCSKEADRHQEPVGESGESPGDETIPTVSAQRSACRGADCVNEQKCRRSKSKRRSKATLQENYMKSRQVVIKMLITVVLTFAICNLPFHIRKICISFLPNYDIGSTFSNLSAPITFLLMYANCAINPIIYAFMSKDFRSSLGDLAKCRFRKNSCRNCRPAFQR